MDGDWVRTPTPQELGVAWLALSPAEQRQRKADLVTAIEHVVTDPHSSWEIELETNDGGSPGLRMDRWKAPALERELLDRVWEASQERNADALPDLRRTELDRAMRAHVLIAWDRYAFKGFIAALALAGLLGLHPWGDRSIGAVALRVAIVTVVVIALGGLVERWYHRSQREPR